MTAEHAVNRIRNYNYGPGTHFDLPFEEIEAPPFEMRADWTLDRFFAFVRRWSAVPRCVEKHHQDPVDHHATELESICEFDGGTQPVSWRIKLRACRKP